MSSVNGSQQVVVESSAISAAAVDVSDSTKATKSILSRVFSAVKSVFKAIGNLFMKAYDGVKSLFVAKPVSQVEELSEYSGIGQTLEQQ